MEPVEGPLRERAFRWFLTGRAVSLLGSSLAPVALAFAVLDASGRASDLGVVAAAHMVPLLGFLLVGGAISDRFPPRTVIVVANLGSGLTQGTVAVVLLTGRYSLLVVASLELANGVLAAFTTPALRGVVPRLVPPEELQRANARLATTRNATKILGPTVAGLLVVTTGSGTAIAVDAVSYLLAAACLLRVRLPRSTPPAPAGVLHDLAQGWTAFRGTRWLWTVTVAFALVNLANAGPWLVLGPVLTSPVTWGVVLSTRGVGMFVASVLMYGVRAPRLLRLGQLASVVGAVPLLALGLDAGAGWLVGAAVLAGLGSSVTATAWDTTLGEHVPRAVLARVSSYDDLLSYAVIPLSQLAVGPLADTLGARPVALGAGVLYAAAAAAPLASRAVRELPRGTTKQAASSQPDPLTDLDSAVRRWPGGRRGRADPSYDP
jgi:hypothetical protein